MGIGEKGPYTWRDVDERMDQLRIDRSQIDQLTRRVKQLEDLSATLAAQLDRQRGVVEAALVWNRTNYRNQNEIDKVLDALGNACDKYESDMAQLTKE